ncbi:putative protein kinase RLK-Pelle-DLSV family [Helianthus annuus]|nr:putative protein kinase RLK-Pelle-DLSV family [Helianthus annuus]KAJ0546106.1 putative protein kinase RLK-Pelle-DLSV family [Helianthus annuus]KAJ0552895.1 putative protein kinase RLK-Pelle-DLSV family [Helianthus annuus]KAJ0718578.1 putative protein kinase RLK-Pelle-DLSV family [Helianthus annuus]KAJ0897095.1 putative protein kinase RLK-Pelle-DLSV family [Helianthus annuus]
MEFGFMIILCSCVLFLLLSSCAPLDTISTNQVFRDGDTIVSDDNMFELGFFSPGKSMNRYLGIWYKKISTGTVVWVANRETPITDDSGRLKLSRQGDLLICSGDNIIIWSSNSTISTISNNPVVVVQLLDTGNLIVWDRSTKNARVIWQSFDHPGNTFLPGMKYGKDLVTGRERVIIPWKSADDPSPGEYLHWLDTNGYPQMFVRKGTVIRWRYGPWNGRNFQALRMKNPNPIYSVQFVFNEKEIYFKYELKTSVVQRIVVLPDDTTEHLRWMDQIQDWVVHSVRAVTEICGGYGLCGPYGSCNGTRYPPCTCMAGFKPRVPDEWDRGNGSSGCERKRDFDCGSGSGFKRISGVIFPDTRRSWYNKSMTLEECEMACSLNCNCTAFANSDIRNGGSGCLLWFDELIDTTESDDKQDLYIKLAATELAAEDRYALDKKDNSVRMEDLDELPLLSLNKIVKATDNFNINKKIGEGGFGPVYKGVLENGQEVAVKRLSETSQQGIEEFKNEIICIAKLQHRNLVKLLGYCNHRNELILVYEYMTNKSLDLYLFDVTRSSMLDWPQRFNIIQGLARGILYLHQDSRLQIIHRDLKAGNILLDGDMNPKISDFGLARKFVGSDTATKTKKVVGTYGYISPEYAIHGRFSIKSDVYSFGVLVLEIVSGRKNREFSHDDRNDNLLGHAWRLYKQGRSIELMCASLDTSCVIPEVLRSIHVALLCVQNHAKDRPTMLTVVLMLVSERVCCLNLNNQLFTLRRPVANLSQYHQLMVP